MTHGKETAAGDASSERDRLDWQAILARHDRWLRTVVGWRVRDADAVAEIMQDVAVAAISQRAPINDPKKVGPWLYRVALRKVLLYRRHMGRRRRFEERLRVDRGREEHSLEADPLTWLVAGERRMFIRQALDRLPERDAQILLLKYTEDWSYRQIADHLGVSRSAVESRLHRARRKLRRELAALQVIEVT